MRVFDNYVMTGWAEVSPPNGWNTYKLVAKNKISGVRRAFLVEELVLMKSHTYRRPPSSIVCTICDLPLDEDGVCRLNCKMMGET